MCQMYTVCLSASFLYVFAVAMILHETEEKKGNHNLVFSNGGFMSVIVIYSATWFKVVHTHTHTQIYIYIYIICAEIKIEMII